MFRFSLFSFSFIGMSLLFPDSGHADAPLALPTAIERVLSQNPALQASAWQVEAALGRQTQAAVFPNPTLGVALEDFGGQSGISLGRASTIINFSQSFELGHKRDYRTAIATVNTREAEQTLLLRRLDMVRDTRLAFVEVQAAVARLRLAQEAQALALDFKNIVQARVTAGKVSSIEASRALVAFKVAEQRTVRAERALAQARYQLAALWGGQPAVTEISAPLELPVVEASLDLEPPVTHPALKQMALVVERQQAVVRASDAQRIPDVTVSAGVRREAITQKNSLQVGVSVPLPLFDRRQGERRAARAELGAAEADLQAARLRLESDIAGERQRLTATRAEAMNLRENVLSLAEQTFNLSQEGYRVGKFSLLNVLDTEQALLEVRSTYLETLVSYHHSAIALDRLLGREHIPVEITP